MLWERAEKRARELVGLWPAARRGRQCERSQAEAVETGPNMAADNECSGILVQGGDR
mgnify:CR=1 FL=1|eukprot:XP_001690503.1 predicted protein [Chlamydomonas reinhardtii]